jgi:hypothetical protein
VRGEEVPGTLFNRVNENTCADLSVLFSFPDKAIN